ncbi:dTDP-4-dehydrorhamnose 3,5-epimerase family protein [Pelagibacteraceae bacterium]|nr:dTDP-4-dehydrorhamnose 3,5-epimerase family protein [Pelagibacteraceae bacterium]|tara:strand:+ start:6910 stop:7419 length:510 start_codon:yes stop_codon:yes gene_type:complete
MKIMNPKVIKTKIHKDPRGSLQEIFKKKQFSNNFEFALFVSSKKNVLRGLHFQKKKQQEKILIIINGEIVDYCLDLRKKSNSFGKIFKYKLKKNSILFIPKGFAHGYLALKNNTQIVYLLSEYRFKKYERTIDINDSKFNLKLKKNYIISKKDKKGMSFNLFKKNIKSL